MPDHAVLRRLSDSLYCYPGSVNTYVLLSGGSAALFNCAAEVKPESLPCPAETVFASCYRRTALGGLRHFDGAVCYAPAKEAHLISHPETFWHNPHYRWRRYHFMPDGDVLTFSVKNVRPVYAGDIIDFHGIRVTVIDTPVNTLGAVSYLFNADGVNFCVTGDAVYEGSRLWELYSMQAPEGRRRGYHGFLAARHMLFAAIPMFITCDTLLPAHGEPIFDPKREMALLKERVGKLYDNYISVSSLNRNYHGDVVPAKRPMKPAANLPIPPWVRRVTHTAYALLSDTGAVFVIDCGHDSVTETLSAWLSEGIIKRVDALFITHPHDDHVDGFERFSAAFACPVYAVGAMCDILAYPARYSGACLSPVSITAIPVADGQTMAWHEYELTFYHQPGQTLYHGAMCVKRGGETLLFIGDSGSPYGIDDYCCQNRHFLGARRGYRAVLDLWERINPDYLLNQHQDWAFRLSGRQIRFIRQKLSEREALLAELLPWPAPGFGIDDGWIRAYPYEQAARPGETVTIALHITNHAARGIAVSAAPVPPEGAVTTEGISEITVPPYQDACLSRAVTLLSGEGQVIIPWLIKLDDRPLGLFRHSLISVIQP